MDGKNVKNTIAETVIVAIVNASTCTLSFQWIYKRNGTAQSVSVQTIISHCSIEALLTQNK